MIATRGHQHDDSATKAALATNASYIGLLGSKRKTILIIEKLLSEGIDDESFSKLRAPVGLGIGARTPEEIAISIMAEILSFRLGGNNNSMMLDQKFIDKIKEKISKTQRINN